MASTGSLTPMPSPRSGQWPSFDLSRHLDDVTDLVRRSGDLALAWYRSLERVENKRAEGFDPVTDADRAVEAELRAGLSEWFSDHQILGEEYGITGESRFRWTIDPIDGTRAFVIGQPMWGTLLGFQVDDEPVAGWMHLPVIAETFVAAPGVQGAAGGCRLLSSEGERTVGVGDTATIDDAVILCTAPEMFDQGAAADSFARVADRARMVRYAGDCLNYGLVAMGLADAVIEDKLASYDIVPLIPIIEAAGGVVTNLEGERPLDGGFVVASATAELHREILAEFGRP